MPTVATVLSHDARVWNLERDEILGALLTDGRAFRAVGTGRGGWGIAYRASEVFRPDTDPVAALSHVCRRSVNSYTSATEPRSFEVGLDAAAQLLADELGMEVLDVAGEHARVD